MPGTVSSWHTVDMNITEWETPSFLPPEATSVLLCVNLCRPFPQLQTKGNTRTQSESFKWTLYHPVCVISQFAFFPHDPVSTQETSRASFHLPYNLSLKGWARLLQYPVNRLLVWLLFFSVSVSPKAMENLCIHTSHGEAFVCLSVCLFLSMLRGGGIFSHFLWAC